jgi:carnosine N-methyltransferase
MFPDICPADMPADANFSMVAGDFLEVYGEDKYLSSQDCVVTCFFIDCAHNILEFIELIHRILKPGGRWINLGPLMYHFADVPRESSIEPSYDIVRNLVEQTGFQFVMEKKDHEATYCQNERSMLQYKYKCIFFTCVKK